MKINKVLYLLLSLLFVLSSCDTEPKKPATAELIIGKWEISSGYRNGKKANSLEGLYFEFKPDGKMITNLLGAQQESNYEIKDQKLIQSGKQSIEYTIESIADSSLNLAMSMRGFDFKLQLKKSE